MAVQQPIAGVAEGGLKMGRSIVMGDHGAATLVRYGEKQASIFQTGNEKDNGWIDVHYTVGSSQLATEPSGVEQGAYSGSFTKRQIRYLQEVQELHGYAHVAFFLRFTRNSNSRLSPSRALFEELLDAFSVNPRFKEFVMSFGLKKREYDFAPPTCKFRSTVSSMASGKFAQGYECAYGLRYVIESNNPDSRKEIWSVRQSAVYQRYDALKRKVVWIFIGASKFWEERIDQHLNMTSVLSAESPFSLHSALVESSLAEWRWYLADLTERVQAQADVITLADVGAAKLAGLADFNINFEDRQKLKTLEDMILNLQIMLGSTISTTSSLLNHYADISDEASITQPRTRPSRNPFAELLADAQMYLIKAEVLHKRVQGASMLLSDLLDYENASSLRILAEDSRIDNIQMRKLTEKATKDSGAMKIITIITVVFLPATVVASFFSTQFVSVSSKDFHVDTSVWIYFAITIPLTLVTLAVWYIVLQASSRNDTRESELQELSVERIGRQVNQRDPERNSLSPHFSDGDAGFSVSSHDPENPSPVTAGFARSRRDWWRPRHHWRSKS